ncbi:hypothetical protein K8Q98_00590 [Candidatus Nomurabacteria bacterium]|nr:hypothetical protein [Candidatus Nomurabacteria bacterium]
MPRDNHFHRIILILRSLTIFLFVSLLVWWIVLQYFYNGALEQQNLFWAASYQIIALTGAISGLIISKYWGGFKSLLGKSIIFFSLALFLQVFGQSAFSFYNLILKVEIPYPSIADFGFVGSIFFFILASIYLTRVVGRRIFSQNRNYLVMIIPLVMLLVSYFFFLKGYVFDWSQPLKIFIDFGNPLGDAIYISLALIALLLSSNFLGGLMRWPMLGVLLALVAQYIADFNFLYQASNLTWVNGGHGDFLYMCSYMITTISLINLGSAFQKIRES